MTITTLSVIIGGTLLTGLSLLGLLLQRRAHLRVESSHREVGEALSTDLKQAREELAKTQRQLTGVKADRDRSQAQLSRTDGRLKVQLARGDDLESQSGQLRKAYEASRDAVARGEEHISTLRAKVEELRAGEEKARQAASLIQTRAQETLAKQEHSYKKHLDKERGRRKAAEHLLSSLQIPKPGTALDPVSTAQRGRTRAYLADLVASTRGAAAALTDHRGLDLVASGPDALVRQLGRLSAWADASLEPLETVLRTPVQTVSAVVSDGGLHAMRLGTDERRWLGIAGPFTSPELGLRMSVARVTGALPTLEVPAVPLALMGPEPARGSSAGDAVALARWAERWKALAVVLVDGEDQVIATSDPAWDVDLTAVAAVSRSWLLRLAMAGAPVLDAELRVGSFAGSRLCIRALESDAGGLLALAVTDTELPADALDELRGTARWNRMIRPAGQSPATDAQEATA